MSECGTDHKLLVPKMEFPWIWTHKKTQELEVENKEQEKKLKLHLLRVESIKYLYQRRLDQKLDIKEKRRNFTIDS